MDLDAALVYIYWDKAIYTGAAPVLVVKSIFLCALHVGHNTVGFHIGPSV